MANKKNYRRADDPRPSAGFFIKDPTTGERIWLTEAEKSLAYTKAKSMFLLGYTQQEIAAEVFAEIKNLRKAKRWFTA